MGNQLPTVFIHSSIFFFITVLFSLTCVAQPYYSHSVDLGNADHDELLNMYYSPDKGIYCTASSAIDNQYSEVFLQLNEIESITSNIRLLDLNDIYFGSTYKNLCSISEDTIAIVSGLQYGFEIKYFANGMLSDSSIYIEYIETGNFPTTQPKMGIVRYKEGIFYIVGLKGNIFFLSKINKRGEEIFYNEYPQVTYDGADHQILRNFIIQDNGMMKFVYRLNRAIQTAWIMTLDANGNFLNTKRYGERIKGLFDGVYVTPRYVSGDDKYYLSWQKDYYRDNINDSAFQFGPLIMAFNRNDEKIWEASLREEVGCGIKDMVRTADGGIVAVGNTGYEVNNSLNVSFIWKINSSGETQWRKFIWDDRYEVYRYAELEYIVQLENGDLFLGGGRSDTVGTDDIKNRNNNLWFVRLDNNGNCYGNDCPTIREEFTVSATHPSSPSGVVSIYPNPADNVVTVSSKKSRFNNIRIYDNTGRKIKEARFIDSNTKRINIAPYQEGFYFILVSDDNGMIARKKLFVH